MSTFVKIFLTFFKIGAFSFGGGYAMIPLIEREVVNNNKWVSYSSFIDIIGLSQMAPGPIAINSATFIGYETKGLLGSIIATFGVILFSFILVSISTHYIIKFKEWKGLKAILIGMRPALIGLIASAFISLAKISYIDIKSVFIGIIIFLLSLNKKIHPIALILASGFLGYLFYL